MDTKKNSQFCDQRWDTSVIPELIEYIKIPNKSPMFDPDWQKNGYMDQVVDQFTTWAKKQEIKGLQLEVVRLEKRTPLIFIEIPGQGLPETGRVLRDRNRVSRIGPGHHGK